MVKLMSWVRPKDFPLQMPPLVLHIGPYGDVLMTSECFLGTSSGRPRDVILPSGKIFNKVNKMSKRKPEGLIKEKKTETGPKIKNNYLQGFLLIQMNASSIRWKEGACRTSATTVKYVMSYIKRSIRCWIE